MVIEHQNGFRMGSKSMFSINYKLYISGKLLQFVGELCKKNVFFRAQFGRWSSSNTPKWLQNDAKSSFSTNYKLHISRKLLQFVGELCKIKVFLEPNLVVGARQILQKCSELCKKLSNSSLSRSISVFQ